MASSWLLQGITSPKRKRVNSRKLFTRLRFGLVLHIKVAMSNYLFICLFAISERLLLGNPLSFDSKLGCQLVPFRRAGSHDRIDLIGLADRGD